jgi:hypothetical protein
MKGATLRTLFWLTAGCTLEISNKKSLSTGTFESDMCDLIRNACILVNEHEPTINGRHTTPSPVSRLSFSPLSSSHHRNSVLATDRISTIRFFHSMKSIPSSTQGVLRKSEATAGALGYAWFLANSLHGSLLICYIVPT